MRTKLHYLDPDNGKKCSIIELVSFVDNKGSHNENLVNNGNVTTQFLSKDKHGDVYSESMEQVYKFCQISPHQSAFIEIQIAEEKRERAHGKKIERTQTIQRVELFGKEFEIAIEKQRKRGFYKDL